MAQFVDVVGVGRVEFPDGMSQQEMEEALRQIPAPPTPSPTPTAAATPPTAPTAAPRPVPTGEPTAAELEAASKPAFLAPRQRATALQARAEQLKTQEAERKANEVPFKDLYENQSYLQTITDGAKARFGASGEPKEGESPEDYIKRFSTAMRMQSTNLIDATTTQNWINGAKREDVLKFAKAVDLFNRTPDFAMWAGDPRGQQGWRPIADYAKAVLSDPTTLLSAGAGSIAAKTITKQVAEKGLKGALKTPSVVGTAATVPAIEGAAGAVQNTYEQKRNIAFADVEADELERVLPQVTDPEQKKELQQQINARRKLVQEGVQVSEALKAGAISSVVGLVEPLALVAAAKGTNRLLGKDPSIDDLRKAQTQQTKAAGSPTKLTGDEANDNVVVTTTNLNDGRNLLDMQGDPTAIALMQIQNKIDKQMDTVASAIWKQMSEYAPKPGEKTFDAVQRVFDNFDKIPENVQRQAFEAAGTDLENFMALLRTSGLDEDALQKLSSMYGVSTSDAARTLQSKSVISRAYNKLKQVNPETAKAVEDLFGKTDGNIGFMAASKAFIDKVDRNMITAMTLNMSTLMRNAVGVGINSTYGAVEQALESAMFNLGRKLSGKARGTAVSGDIGQGLGQSIEDGLSLWYYLGQGDLANDITKYALDANPQLMGKMLATIDEGKRSDLIAPVRMLNTPAVMLDSYLRKAAFAASVDNSLRRVGSSLSEVVSQNKTIPIEISRKGVDDALLFTFSKSPTDAVGSSFIKVVEATRPISTVAVPFARFMTNAMRWTWRHYNPGITAAGGAVDIGRGISALKAGDDKIGQQLLQQGSDKMAKQMMGMATLLGAYAYRAENQDVPWNIVKGDDGTEYDIQYYFPMNIPMIFADFYYKTAKGVPEDFNFKDFLTAVTGFKAAGVQGDFVDTMREALGTFTGEEDDQTAANKLQSSLSDMFGKWLGRTTVPFNQISDIISAFDSNEGIPRDVYVATGTETISAGESIVRQMQKGIPFAKQATPEFQPATREVAPYRDTGILKQMTGLTVMPFKNEIEKEIARLNINPQTVFRTTGDKTLDDLARRKLATEILPQMFESLTQTDAYKGATTEAQNRELSNRLREAQLQAKKIAMAEYTQKFYDAGKVPPIDQKTFQSLNPKLRKMTIDLYKQQTNEDLFEGKDPMRFRMAIEMAKSLNKSPLVMRDVQELGYAAGGIVGKAVRKAAAKGATTAIKPVTQLLEEMQQSAAQRTAVEAVPSVKPTKAAPPPAVTETQKLLSKEPEAVPTESFAADVMKAESEFVEPPKGINYTDEDYSLGEALFKEQMGDTQFNAIKQNDPKAFDDYMESFTKMATGKKSSKYEDMMAKKLDEVDDVGDIADEIEYDIDGNPIEPGTGAPIATQLTPPPKKFVPNVDIGDLNKLSVNPTNVTKRKDILSSLKDIRSSEFEMIKADNRFDKYNDDVLATAQADYRYITGKEFDSFDDAAVDKYEQLVQKYQKKYDTLQEKYKDMPPVQLYHGASSERSAESIKKTGFVDPQKHTSYHSELSVGAPSFSKDFSLYSQQATFGGQQPERFAVIDIPYATYMFRRINMSIPSYDKSDLNVLARAITGSPDVVRPVSLPRGGLKETEDALLEPEKLKLNKDVGGISLRVGKDIQGEVSKKIALTEDIEKVADKSLDINDMLYKVANDPTPAKVAQAYNEVKMLLKNELRRSEATSTKTGLGQRYQYSLRYKMPTRPALTNLADLLDSYGMKQKAANISNFIEQKKKLAEVEYESSLPSEAKKAKEAVDSIRKLTDKFAKGGLAAR